MENGTYFGIETPNYCAGCGEALNMTDPHNRFDFINSNGFTCSCGVPYIRVNEKQLDPAVTEELNRY